MSFNSLLMGSIGELAHEEEVAATLIRQDLLSSKPSMIARFGSVEIKGILYPKMPFLLRKLLKVKIFEALGNNAGFFPVTDDSVSRFSELMYKDMMDLDILGSWRSEEVLLRKHLHAVKFVKLKCLEPYLSSNPWTEVLEGKKVLVVHPFSTTIERQYHQNREFLFADKRVLPRFQSLETIKAVQTIAGNESEFNDWFEALGSMKTAIDQKEYDVAILGCGAYGFSLAAHIKRCGKKAIHLGGATQILFGIRGRRWDSHTVISGFYNDHWVRPDPVDVPSGAANVENGCYW